jgi:hypothetical protein
MTAEELDYIASAGERGMAAAGFTWRPYPPPAGTTYRLTDRRFYLVRDNLNESRECEFVANVCGFAGPAFIGADGDQVEVTEVFCSLEREEES